MEMAAISNASGDFIFSIAGNTAIGSVSESVGSEFKEVGILQGKPRLDRVGGQLRKITINGVIAKVDDGSKIEELYALKESGLPITYVKAGRNRGQWTIQRIQHKEKILPNGMSNLTTFTFQMTEFVNE